MRHKDILKHQNIYLLQGNYQFLNDYKEHSFLQSLSLSTKHNVANISYPSISSPSFTTSSTILGKNSFAGKSLNIRNKWFLKLAINFSATKGLQLIL